MSAINAYLAVYHLTLALYRPRAREHLPFALLCGSLAAYDVFCVGLYSATDLEHGVYWQRLQLQTIAVIGLAMVWFIGRLTGTERTRPMRGMIAWFALIIPLTFLRRAGITLSVTTPAVKQISWAGRPLITYHESDVGVVLLSAVASAFGVFIYLVVVLYRYYRRRPTSHVLAILIGNLTYFLACTNDFMVASRVYSSIYLSEYGFLILTISMSYVLLCRFIELQSDVEALNINLERTVEQRTAALQSSLEQQRAMQAQLVAASRRLGMADVASDVLHNLGNALNSVNVSVEVMRDAVQHSRLSGLSKVIRLIAEHRGDLSGFLASERATRLPEYLVASSEALEAERAELTGELASLRHHIEHIHLVIATQQSHAHAPALAQRTELAGVLDEALAAGASRHPHPDVAIERAFEVVPAVDVDRHKLLQIVSSLLDNAWDAVDAGAARRITVRLRAIDAAWVAIDVEDSGCGIAPENLTRIFQHGFTTRKQHHGFGLHASACAAGELGGALTAASDGLDRGARFTLTLPARPGARADERAVG